MLHGVGSESEEFLDRQGIFFFFFLTWRTTKFLNKISFKEWKRKFIIFRDKSSVLYPKIFLEGARLT